MESTQPQIDNYDESDINFGILLEEEPAPLNSPAIASPIELHLSEIQDFKVLIFSLAFTLISLGILLNLLFKFLIIFRRKRQTTTTLLLFSLSSGYVLLLSVYTVKLTAYLHGDNILTFHMYDSIDNWTYGEIMCRVTSGTPMLVKLLSQFTMISIVLKRLLKAKKVCDCEISEVSRSEDEQDMLNHEDAKLSNTNKYGIPYQDGSSPQPHKPSLSTLNCLIKTFEWPFILILGLATWLFSLTASLPMFFNFQLSPTNGPNLRCNSVYKFPEDSISVRNLYLNYIIFGLALPSSFTLACLILLFVVQLKCCSRRFQNPHFSKSSPLKRKHDQSATTNSSSNSSSTSFSSVNNLKSCTRSQSNNMLIWLMLVVHLATSLPQDLYRYSQLNKNFTDSEVMENYLTVISDPMPRAKPYYSLQLLYISEAVLMPALFVIFFLCSLRRARPTRTESDADLSKGKCRPTESAWYQFVRSIFFDVELSKSKKHNSFLTICKPSAQAPTKENKVFLPSGESPFPQVTATTPYGQCSNNVMHIIQHPSWRINIKQQKRHQEQTDDNINTTN